MVRYVVVLLYLTSRCHGWHSSVLGNNGRPRPRRSSPSRLLTTSPMNNAKNDDGGDEDYPVVLTTKTKKNIVYDEGSGRFFEVGKESPNALVPKEPEEEEGTPHGAAAITIPPEFSSTDMVPTDILFQRDIARRLKQKERDEKTESPSAGTKRVAEQTKKRETEEKTQQETTTTVVVPQPPSPPPTRKKVPYDDFSNEMIPTEILFADDIKRRLEMEGGTSNSKPEQVVASAAPPEASPVDEDDDDKSNVSTEQELKPKSTANNNITRRSSKNIVETCYEAWNERDMDAVVSCFDPANFQYYQDTLYFDGTITSRDDLKAHFTRQANLLPEGSRIVTKHIAIDERTAGTQWTVVRNNNIGASSSSSSKEDGVPFTNGCSFYDLDETTGLITKGVRASEMWFKPSPGIANIIVSSAANIWRTEEASSATTTVPAPSASSSYSSIIEKYFDAWNNRDFDSALSCFVDDCVYRTEDPVFVNRLVGKEALRKHLVQNAKSLPPTCRIVLDNIAVGEGTVGTRWHLEINNGFALMSGVSMYTTDGPLLKTGYDVTEAPLKLPRSLLPALSLPAKLLFGS